MLNAAMADFEQVAEIELKKMCRHYGPCMDNIRSAFILNQIKQQCREDYFVRIHQSSERWDTVLDCLNKRKLPLSIVNVVFEYVNTAGKNSYNPLMICTWQSDPCAATRRNLIGLPPCAIEFIDAQSCNKHRDDIDIETLSPREKISFKLNTPFVDEVWVEHPVYPQLRELQEWVTIFSALLYDDDGNHFVYAFFFANFTEYEKNDHVVEFGWRMDIPEEKAVEFLQWMRGYNFEFNLKTGEISIEAFS